MKILSRIYTIYALICFVLTFLLLSPVFLLAAQQVEWHNIVLKTYRIWADIYFPMIFMRRKIECRFDPEKGQQYLICANHFSFFDIPSIVQLPFTSKFIGKSSIASVPVFGYKFRKVHITVDRSSLRSRAGSMMKANEALDQGFNLAFFPEGGIRSTNPPQLAPFRDGAFRLAVERQLPVVPVVLPNNHKILPDDGKFFLRNYTLRMVALPPVYPRGKDDKEISRLRTEVFEIIQKHLNELAK